MSDLAIAKEPADSAVAIACVTAYFAELAARFEGGFDPGQPGYANPKDMPAISSSQGAASRSSAAGR